MHETPLDIAVIVAFWLAPAVVVFFLLRKEARETRRSSTLWRADCRVVLSD
jgi:hypothetical protein